MWNAPAWLERLLPPTDGATGAHGGPVEGTGTDAAGGGPAGPEAKGPKIAAFTGKGARLGKK